MNLDIGINAVGVDEVGLGCWAGPLFVCAAQFFTQPEMQFFDSKALSHKKRVELAQYIYQVAKIKISIIEVSVINELGLGQAHKKAMHEAVADFSGPIFIDGNKKHGLDCVPIVKGDAKVQIISAASIVAKVARDNLMCELDKLWPMYGWSANKGYGTKQHIEAIKKYGLCELHRNYNLQKYL